MAKTITSANAVYQLVIDGLFPVPQQLQGFAADAAFATEARSTKELVRGVDGNLSAGYVFSNIVQTISIMPDSPSLLVFDIWQNAEEVAHEAYACSATILIPSIGRKYACTRGFLTSAPPIVSVNRTLGAQAFQITWQKVIGEPY
jgi:hypothetical protein